MHSFDSGVEGKRKVNLKQTDEQNKSNTSAEKNTTKADRHTIKIKSQQ